MVDELEIQERLRDTYAAISKLSSASTSSTDSKSKKVVEASLNKRKRRLEKKYKNALVESGMEARDCRAFKEVRAKSQIEE